MTIQQMLLATAEGDSGLYPFTTFTFTPAGQTGKNGPTLTQLQSAYSGAAFLSGYFTSSNGIQFWTAPKTGVYEIELRGGSGGGAVNYNATYTAGPGLGATIITRPTLTANTQYALVVGQQAEPSDNGGTGGGGGSFMYTGPIGGSGLIAAAGGGGGWYRYNNGANGMGGSGTTDSRRAGVGDTINGVTQNGTGSSNGIGYGGGIQFTGSYNASSSGAGWLSIGSSNSFNYLGTNYTSGPGLHWTGGSSGSTLEGGFGGGGGSNDTYYGSGGGGGYTGGPTGNGYLPPWGAGGGGGSYYIASELVAAYNGLNGNGGAAGTSNNPQDGQIKITFIG